MPTSFQAGGHFLICTVLQAAALLCCQPFCVPVQISYPEFAQRNLYHVITFPACPALATKQPNELLLHLAPTVRADTLACAHIASLELGKDFFSSHTTGQQLLQHILGFAFLGFLCCLCFGSSLLCFSLRQIFSSSL